MIPSKKVAILKSSISRLGGVEKHACRIAHAMHAAGCDVTLVTSGPLPKEIANSPVKTANVGSLSRMSYRSITEFEKRCQEILKREKMDLIFGMDRNIEPTHLRAGNGVHAAYLKHRAVQDSFFKRLTYPVNPLHQLLLRIEKQSFENPRLQKLFTNSHMVRDEILRHYSTDPKKIEVIHNGVEWYEMQKPFDKSQKEKRDGPFQFLFIGNNYHRKGLEQLLRGLSLLKDRDFHLVVAGKEKRPKRFHMLSHRLGLSDRVTFLGSQADTTSLYAAADALVIPSFYDPFANVTVEALAMGVFVVSSMTNGGHEIITEENGTKIESLLSPESMCASLEIALARPKTEQSAKRIRQSVKHLDFSNQLHKLIQSCL